MPPTEPADPTGPLHQPNEHGGLIPEPIDIGVGDSTGQRPRQLPQRNTGSTSPLKVVGGLAAVIAVAALVVGLLTGGGNDRANESPLPAPTAPPEVLDDLAGNGTGDPARPGPTPTVQVPVVSDGLLRAGETCRIPLDDDGTQVIFTVPDGRTMRDCSTDGLLLRDPGSERADALAQVLLSSQTLGLNLNQLRGDEAWSEAAAVWHPVDNRRGYRLRRLTDELGEVDQLDLIEVPGGTLVVARYDHDPGARIAPTVDELVATIRVDGPDALPPPPLPQPGGWCGSEDFVTQVPATWFAGERCRWLNTSSESPIVLQCECLPPVWVEALDIPFDGDFGFNSIDVDRLVTRPGGRVIRIIEGLRRDANNMDRPLRVIVVDGGAKRVTVVATEFPEHVVTGHTWQETLDVQQFLVDNLRFHAQADCDAPTERLVVDPSDGRSGVQVTGEFVSLQRGTLVETTGCVEGDSVEVQLVAAPEVVGWMESDDLRAQTIELCRSGEPDFRPHEWLSAVVGDFDGDGRDDAAYLRDTADGSSDVAVLFANGGLAEAFELPPVDELPTVERVVGLGRDVLQVIDRQDRGAVVSLLGATPCEIVELGSWPLGFVDGARHNSCVFQDGPLRGFRTWSESFDDRQGWVAESDLNWFAVDADFDTIDRRRIVGAPALCGPPLTEFAPEVDPASPGASLAGEHQLTLQWIEARDETTGTIEFTPIGRDRYEVDGVHEAAFGFLSMRGVIERIDDTTFLFDGTISSQIPWLNLGEPCIRKAGQRFVLRTATPTPTFRMQDRINCDGARTDWIDLKLSE